MNEQGFYYVAYSYDVFNRRVSRRVDLEEFGLDEFGNPYLTQMVVADERFIYDGANVVLDVAPNGGSETLNVKRRYLYGPAVDQILAQENVAETENLYANPVAHADRVYWFLSDNLGSTRELINNAGDLVEHFDYESFGTLIEGDDELTRYLFTGRELDSFTGQIYYRNRWYNSELAKFFTEDPIGRFNWQNGTSLGTYGGHSGLVFTQFADGTNPYLLAKNNPTNWTDRDGLVAGPLTPAQCKAVYDAEIAAAKLYYDVDVMVATTPAQRAKAWAVYQAAERAAFVKALACEKAWEFCEQLKNLRNWYRFIVPPIIPNWPKLRTPKGDVDMA